MHVSFSHKILLFFVALVALMAVGLVIELLIIKYNGRAVPVPNIPREAETYGQGDPLSFVVLGDSTTVAQGGDYDQGIARSGARALASGEQRQVTLRNFGVSGARTADVLQNQVPKALEANPDVVLLAVAANDVTHLTSLESIRRDLLSIVRKLREANPSVAIVVTGAPAMGSVPRFPEPIRSLAGLRTDQVNKLVRDVAQRENLIFAPVADRTRAEFARRPDKYFAADKFHPNTAGYGLWSEVINPSLRQAAAGTTAAPR